MLTDLPTSLIPPTSDDRLIWDLWLTHTYQAAIVAADDANVFAALVQTPMTIAELAHQLDVDVRAAGILLRLLGSLGLLVSRDGRFALTDHARVYLLKSSPFYWGPMMRVGVNEWHLSRLSQVLAAKGSAEAAGPEGTPAPEGTGRSADSWAIGSVSLEQARAITARMHSHSVLPALAAARTADLAAVSRVLDVGGGSGCFAIAMAQAHAHIRATVMDLPAMCELAREYIAAGGVADRVDTAAVDMFRHPWPGGCDAVFFSNVWHDWNVKTCTWLARRAYDILPSGGRILLHEMLLDDDGCGPATAASFSMLMLLATQGQQFTFGELEAILERVGFERVTVTHSSGYYSITSAIKPAS